MDALFPFWDLGEEERSIELGYNPLGHERNMILRRENWKIFNDQGYELNLDTEVSTLVLGGPETTVPWEYQRRATGVTARETNNLLEDIMLAFLPLTSRWQMAQRNWLKCVYFDLFP